MEIKKTTKANLEKDKSLNYMMGLVIALAVLFVGFEWGEIDIAVATNSSKAIPIDVVEIEASTQIDPPPPPVEPEPVKVMEIINLVADNIEVDPFNFTSEDDVSLAQIAIYVAPVAIIDEPVDENVIFFAVEEMPRFPGGDAALMKWISDHINYPTIAQENHIQGLVSCQFVVNADGSVSDVEVLRPLNQYLDNEAIRVLKMLPKFEPGKQRDKAVRVRFSVPVRFQLQP